MFPPLLMQSIMYCSNKPAVGKAPTAGLFNLPDRMTWNTNHAVYSADTLAGSHRLRVGNTEHAIRV